MRNFISVIFNIREDYITSDDKSRTPKFSTRPKKGLLVQVDFIPSRINQRPFD
jgi:hypothetical protein